MDSRINYHKKAPEALKGMQELEQYLHSSDLEQSLYELVKLRASQINGCAYCIDMHSKDARVVGESEQRIYALNAWRETNFYTDRERAALAWTEELTKISEREVSDELYDETRQYFGEKELVTLTMAVIAINGWNRLAISMRTEPGSYKPELAS